MPHRISHGAYKDPLARSRRSDSSWVRSPCGIVYIEVYSNDTAAPTYPQQEIAAGLSAGLLLVGLVIGAPAAPLNRFSRLRPIVWIGTISYGLYIYFIPVFILLDTFFLRRGWTNDSCVFLATQLPVMFAMATLSYYLVERRFLAIKDRLGAGPRRKPAHARGTQSQGGADPSAAPLPAPTITTSIMEGASSGLYDQDA